MTDVLRDLRYAWRLIGRDRPFSLTVIVVLAVGIGATTALFSLVGAVLLRPLPYRDAAQLVALWETHPTLGKLEVAYPDFVDWTHGLRDVARVAAFTMPGHAELSLQTSGAPERVSGTLASHELFPLLGMDAAIGRVFGADEDRPGFDRVAVISDRLWRHAFGAQPRIVGQTIRLNGESFVVIGVLPPDIDVAPWADVWLPLSRVAPLAREQRQWHLLQVVGRVRTGVSLSQVDAALQSIVRRLQADHPVTNKPTGGFLMPLRAEIVGQASTLLPILFAATALVLLIACANVATMMSTRAVARRRDVLVRLALGASGLQLLRQIAMECLLLAAFGGIGGVLIASAAIGPLRSAAADFVPRAAHASLDLSTLLFSTMLVAITAIVCGISPALLVWRADGDRASALALRSASAPKSVRFDTLIAVEFALATIVLVGAALLGRSLLHLVTLDPGFRASEVLTLRVSSSTSIAPAAADAAFLARLLPKLEALPGVQGVAVSGTAPLARSGSRFAITDRPEPAAGAFPVSQNRTVSPSYFAVLGVPMIHGRPFDARDIGSRNIAVNRAFMHRFFDGRDPTGKTITRGLFGRRWTAPIVAVVEDTRELGLDVEPEPTIYFCGLGDAGTLLIRTAVDPHQIVGLVRREIAAMDPSRTMDDVLTWREALVQPLGRRRVSVGVFAGMGLIAAALAGLGVFGVMSYAVAQRTREIAIRVALGAHRRTILAMLLTETARPVGAGLIAGLIAAASAKPVLAAWLLDVHASDPASFAVAAIGLLIVALATGGLVARRASRVDPALALTRDA
jgi:putative ABC transport system permease protein